MNTEIFKKFNDNGKELSEYGLTCEMWSPDLMQKQDRHNEIEVNYFPDGGLTYLFHDRKVEVPPRRFVVFWGLIPHQIVSYRQPVPYYVCTIPVSVFLNWKLPEPFVRTVMSGNVFVDASDINSSYDICMLDNWLHDIRDPGCRDLVLLELHARFARMAYGFDRSGVQGQIRDHETSIVEKIAVYIARNYNRPLQVADISRSVGLHPDYANAIFKKTFHCTIYEYVIKERVSRAQRLLIATDMNISDIVYDCGFNSISSFNAAFLKLSGCTPRVYRKRNGLSAE